MMNESDASDITQPPRWQNMFRRVWSEPAFIRRHGFLRFDPGNGFTSTQQNKESPCRRTYSLRKNDWC